MNNKGQASIEAFIGIMIFSMGLYIGILGTFLSLPSAKLVDDNIYISIYHTRGGTKIASGWYELGKQVSFKEVVK